MSLLWCIGGIVPLTLKESKCGCVHDLQVWGGIPMAEIVKECKKHNEAREKSIEAYMKRKKEAREKRKQ